ncbi:MAG: ATP phosphoribosyltransferase [Pseudomonadota bacterium]|nr:ATP phosphoribosyltransferase [Pseudomonadota bacterium]
MNKKRIKIAIQKSGRLADHSYDLLKKCGLVVSQNKGQLIGYAENMPFDLLFVRDDDIPSLVKDNLTDLGIVGLNVVLEKQFEYANSTQKELFSIEEYLDFGQCRLSFAYPEVSDIQSLSQLKNKKVATSYPFIVGDYLERESLDVEIVKLSGALELAPSLGSADAICDLVSSGRTLRAHNLNEGESILEITAVVIRSGDTSDPFKQKWIRKLLERINGVLQVRESKYVMMHAPRNSIDRITELIPGAESPTIIPLEGTDETVALHVVCKEDVFWETLENLKQEGASSILVVPVEKMLV